MVLAALLVFATVRQALAARPPWESAMAALVAALAFGLSPLAWSQAVITEVYALHALFISMLLYLTTAWSSDSQGKNGAIGLVQGLAIGNHVLSILMVPGVMAAVCLRQVPNLRNKSMDWRNWRWSWPSFASLSLGIVGGLLSYIILPLRARAFPPVNWGNPVTADRFLWLVSGQLYHDSVVPLDLAGLFQHLQAWASLTLQQFGLPGLVIALVGVTVFFSPSRIYFLTIWTALVFTAFSLQYVVTDWFVYLLPVYLSASIWIGLSIGHLAGMLTRYAPWTRLLAGPLCLVYLVILAAGTWPSVDASHAQDAENYGRRIMDTAPTRAILFAEGDQTVFTLWYFHYALRERPDIVVIASDLLPFDWYRENLRYTYPSLKLPDSTPDIWTSTIQRSNPDRVGCFASSQDQTLACQNGAVAIPVVERNSAPDNRE